MKRCTKCGEEKPLDEFYPQLQGDGHTSQCRVCIRAAVLQRKYDREEERAVGEQLADLKERDGMFRARSSTFRITTREAKDQRVAMFEATISKLRKELNVWWTVSRGGEEPMAPSMKLSVRRLVEKAAEDGRAIGR